MSDLAAAASAMNVPETLVQRSAEARAAASGASVDEILSAWAGGGSAPAPTPPPAAEPAPEPEPAPAEEAAPPPPAAAAEPEPVAAPVAVMVEPEEEAEPIDPVDLRTRSRVGGRTGALLGTVASVLVMVFSAQWTLARAGEMPEMPGTFAVSLVPGWLVLGSSLIGLVVGVAIAAAVRQITGWREPGMRLVSSQSGTLVIGGVAGLAVGAVVAALVAGAGVPDALDETVVFVGIVPAILWTLLGWTAGGWLVGSLVHVMGVPDGVVGDAAEDGATVQGRLAAAYSLPVLAVLGLAAVVLPAAWVFIQFPSWAPVVAIFISGAILGFAGLSANRPGMRITTPEFLAAAAGVGVVVLIIVSVLLVQGGGEHHGDEDHSEEGGDSEAAIVLVVA